LFGCAAGQLHRSLYRPALLKLLVRTGSVERAREELGAEPTPPVPAVLPPTVLITAPDRSGLDVAQPDLVVRAVARGQAGRPVTSLLLLVNGRPYEGERGRRAVPPAEVRDARGNEVRREWEVVLSPGKNQIMVEAASAASKGLSDPIDVTYTAPLDRKPRLYVLLIGISQYPGRLRLEYAAKDALDLERTFRAKSAPVFEQVKTRALTDGRATRLGILEGLRWLHDVMTDRDVAVVFFAGHGQLDEIDEFHLVPIDADADNLAGTGLPGSQLRTRLAAIKGRVLVLLDACRAGAVDGKRGRDLEPLDDLVRKLAGADAGVVVMCAATDRESALEGNEVRQGYFTKALIEGLSGQADINRDGLVKLFELEAYVSNRVSELSRDRQHSVTAKPPSIKSFDLARP
jgi:hypothetical protein